MEGPGCRGRIGSAYLFDGMGLRALKSSGDATATANEKRKKMRKEFFMVSRKGEDLKNGLQRGAKGQVDLIIRDKRSCVVEINL